MSQKLLRIRLEAREEINLAFEWYLQRSPRAADAFLSELDAVLAHIVSHPQLHLVYTENTRRSILERFPYSVIFQEKDDTILVIAIAHAKRRPGYWAKRVQP
jgi:plasmid stabilization system protein ParE